MDQIQFSFEPWETVKEEIEQHQLYLHEPHSGSIVKLLLRGSLNSYSPPEEAATARLEGKLIGWCAIGKKDITKNKQDYPDLLPEDYIQLINVFVDPTFRKQGIADKLVRSAIEHYPTDNKTIFYDGEKPWVRNLIEKSPGYKADEFGMLFATVEAKAPGKERFKWTKETGDGDGFEINVKDVKSGKHVGNIAVVHEYVGDADDIDNSLFMPYKDEPFIDKLLENEYVTDIRSLDVEPEYQGQGVAKYIYNLALQEIKKVWPDAPIIINASPMGDEGLEFNDLIAFYKKAGFKVLKRFDEHRNALLWLDSPKKVKLVAAIDEEKLKKFRQYTAWQKPTFEEFTEEMEGEEGHYIPFIEGGLEGLYKNGKIVTLTDAQMENIGRGDGDTPPMEWLVDPSVVPEGAKGWDHSQYRYYQKHHDEGAIIDRFLKNQPLWMPIVGDYGKGNFLASAGRHRIAYSHALGIPCKVFMIDGKILNAAVEQYFEESKNKRANSGIEDTDYPYYHVSDHPNKPTIHRRKGIKIGNQRADVDPYGIYLFPKKVKIDLEGWDAKQYRWDAKLKPSAKVLNLNGNVELVARKAGVTPLSVISKISSFLSFYRNRLKELMDEIDREIKKTPAWEGRPRDWATIVSTLRMGEGHYETYKAELAPIYKAWSAWIDINENAWAAMITHFHTEGSDAITNWLKKSWDVLSDEEGQTILWGEPQLIVLNPKVIDWLKREDNVPDKEVYRLAGSLNSIKKEFNELYSDEDFYEDEFINFYDGDDGPKAKQFYEASYSDFTRRLNTWNYGSHGVKCWRMIGLKNPKKMNLDNLGNAWSYTKEMAHSWYEGSGKQYLFEAEIPEDAIDREVTLRQNLVNPDEEEIRTLEHSDIYLNCVYDEAGNKIKEFSPPMKTSTGGVGAFGDWVAGHLEAGAKGDWKAEGYTLHVSQLRPQDSEDWDRLMEFSQGAGHSVVFYIKPKGKKMGEDDETLDHYKKFKQYLPLCKSGEYVQDSGQDWPFCYALDKNGDLVGGLILGGHEVIVNRVQPDARRKGISEAMHAMMKEKNGSFGRGSLSPDGLKLWEGVDKKKSVGAYELHKQPMDPLNAGGTTDEIVAWINNNIYDIEDIDIRKDAEKFRKLYASVAHQSTITIYRGLNLESPDEADPKKFGLSWAFDSRENEYVKDGRLGQRRLKTFLFTGKVNPKDIDWGITLMALINWPEQNECRLLPGAKVDITEIDGKAIEPKQAAADYVGPAGNPNAPQVVPYVTHPMDDPFLSIARLMAGLKRETWPKHMTNHELAIHWDDMAYGDWRDEGEMGSEGEILEALERIENDYESDTIWTLVKLKVSDVEGHHSGHDASDEYVADYAAKKKTGSDFPPIIVEHDEEHEGKYKTIDGQHRLFASKKLNEPYIWAYVPDQNEEGRATGNWMSWESKPPYSAHPMDDPFANVGSPTERIGPWPSVPPGANRHVESKARLDMAFITKSAQWYIDHFFKGMPMPEFKITNQLKANWLGRCEYQSDWKLPVIQLQKSILGDEQTTDRVIAHEMVHAWNYLFEPAHVEYFNAFRDKETYPQGVPRQVAERLKRALRAVGGHGKAFMAWADKINAVKGKDFVAESSDEKDVVADIDKEFFVLVEQTKDGRYAYNSFVKPTKNIREAIDYRQKNFGAKLFKTNDMNFLAKKSLKLYEGALVPKDKDKQEKLEKIFKSGKVVTAQVVEAAAQFKNAVQAWNGKSPIKNAIWLDGSIYPLDASPLEWVQKNLNVPEPDLADALAAEGNAELPDDFFRIYKPMIVQDLLFTLYDMNKPEEFQDFVLKILLQRKPLPQEFTFQTVQPARKKDVLVTDFMKKGKMSLSAGPLPERLEDYIMGEESFPSPEELEPYRKTLQKELKALYPSRYAKLYRGLAYPASPEQLGEIFTDPSILISFTESKSTAIAIAKQRAMDYDEYGYAIEIDVPTSAIYFHWKLDPIGKEHPKEKEVLINPYSYEWKVIKAFAPGGEKVAASVESKKSKDLDLAGDHDDILKWIEKNAPDVEIKGGGPEAEMMLNRVDAYQYKYEQVMRSPTVTLYRAVVLKSIDALDTKKIGTHWSFEKDGAGAYGLNRSMHKDDKEFILTGIAQTKDIDWEYGFTSFLYYGEDQWECALNPGAHVEITQVDEEPLEKPLRTTAVEAGLQVDFHTVMCDAEHIEPQDLVARFNDCEMMIPNDAIFEKHPYQTDFPDGREQQPHVTVFFGLEHGEDEVDIAEHVAEMPPLEFTIGNISAFRNEDMPYDVLKVEITSPQMEKLHYWIKDNFDNECKFPFRGHMTLAYIKKGTCQSLEGPCEWTGSTYACNTLTFSHKDDGLHEMPMAQMVEAKSNDDTFDKWYALYGDDQGLRIALGMDPSDNEKPVDKELASKWYSRRNKQVQRMLKEVKKGSNVHVYRCMKVEPDWLEKLKDGKVKNIGHHWTIDRDSVPYLCGGHGGKIKDGQIILEGVVPYNELDLEAAFNPSWADEWEEFEVGVSNVNLVCVWDKEMKHMLWKPRHPTKLSAATEDLRPAAGIMYKTGEKILLLKRAHDSSAPLMWCLPGGKVELGENGKPIEDLKEAAMRESVEEIGGVPDGADWLGSVSNDFEHINYTTFLVEVPEQFDPILNEEHIEWAWSDWDFLPGMIHPGVARSVEQFEEEGLLENI